jgi:hypothetical protein
MCDKIHIADVEVEEAEADMSCSAPQIGETSQAISDGGMRLQAHGRGALLLPRRFQHGLRAIRSKR